jgi:pimeloyl-ACP methyl ester carboxylesterase
MFLVNQNGLRIHYQVEGAGSPLVLYHGMSDNLVRWQNLLLPYITSFLDTVGSPEALTANPSATT